MAYSAKVLPAALVGNPSEFVASITVLNTQGVTAVVGTPSVIVNQVDNSGNVTRAKGSTVPSNGDAGYATGCIFTDTTGGASSTLFINSGSATSAVWSGVNSGTGPASAAVNSTATATAAQVATGRITSTSAAATTITLPTGTLLGAALGAVAGTVFNLVVDNTAGASTVTIAVATNGILSAAAAAGGGAGFGLLTVPSGVTGVGQFTLMFSSATEYAFSRTA